MAGGVVGEPGLGTKNLRRTTDGNGVSFNGAWCGITSEITKGRSEVIGRLGEKWALDLNSPDLVGPPSHDQIEAPQVRFPERLLLRRPFHWHVHYKAHLDAISKWKRKK